jgi:EAL domain-containing protein (putative c-di-GMP-specific phosphodiesterase class I)
MPSEQELLDTPYNKWGELPKVQLRREFYTESDLENVVSFEVFVHEGRKYKADRFRFILFSPNYDAKVGIGHAELSGKTPYEGLTTHDAAKISRHYEDCIEAGKPWVYSEYLKIGGRWRWWKTSLKPIWMGNRIWKLNGHSTQIVSIEAALRDGLRRGELEPYYQPIYRIFGDECGQNSDAISQCLAGFESLMRWPGSQYTPGDFIPIAKRSGLIEVITKLSIDNATQALNKFPSHLWISVNVSTGRLDDYLAQKVVGIDPARLRLEITEDTEIGPEILEQFARISLLGHPWELDDFGTKSSNFDWFSKIDPIAIKLDRQFVTGAHKDPNRANICQQAIALAKGHIPPLEVIMEGVESPDDLMFARGLGADYIQGWLWGRAIPLKDAIELCQEQ